MMPSANLSKDHLSEPKINNRKPTKNTAFCKRATIFLPGSLQFPWLQFIVRFLRPRQPGALTQILDCCKVPEPHVALQDPSSVQFPQSGKINRFRHNVCLKPYRIDQFLLWLKYLDH